MNSGVVFPSAVQVTLLEGYEHSDPKKPDRKGYVGEAEANPRPHNARSGKSMIKVQRPLRCLPKLKYLLTDLSTTGSLLIRRILRPIANRSLRCSNSFTFSEIVTRKRFALKNAVHRIPAPHDWEITLNSSWVAASVSSSGWPPSRQFASTDGLNA